MMRPGMNADFVPTHVLVPKNVRIRDNSRTDNEERCLELLLGKVFQQFVELLERKIHLIIESMSKQKKAYALYGVGPSSKLMPQVNLSGQTVMSVGLVKPPHVHHPRFDASAANVGFQQA